MKKLLVILLALCLLLSLAACGGKSGKAAPAPAETAEPVVEEAVPVDDGWTHIKTPEDFLHIADDLDGKYILDADLNDWWGGVSTVFTPIGSEDAPFTGELNGNGHRITGTLAYTGEEADWGLFGCSAGYIHDLTLGYISVPTLFSREGDYASEDRSYSAVDAEDFPVEKTQNYGVLCGVNRGTIENVSIEDRASMPDMNLLRNENEHISIGLICGRNEGTVSGVSMNVIYLIYRSLDKSTEAAIGLVCGCQTAEAMLERVSITESYVNLYGWIENAQHFAPAVYAGLLIGEAEGGTTLRGPLELANSLQVRTNHALVDRDLRFGGLIGWAQGDIALSGVKLSDLLVSVDTTTNQDGYAPVGGHPLAAGGLIGWADGNVTLSDIQMTDVDVDVIRREGGDSLPVYAGGLVAYCGGELTAEAVSLSMEGGSNTVDASPEHGDGYAGGLCGCCAGDATVTNSRFSVLMNPVFNGRTLYEANVLGYVCGNAVFDGVEADCGVDEYSGESQSHGFIVSGRSSYYLAALAGCAEGAVTVQNCAVDVAYSLFGNPGAVYGGGEQGFFNRR